jgi:hypothetical protein
MAYPTVIKLTTAPSISDTVGFSDILMLTKGQLKNMFIAKSVKPNIRTIRAKAGHP